MRDIRIPVQTSPHASMCRSGFFATIEPIAVCVRTEWDNSIFWSQERQLAAAEADLLGPCRTAHSHGVAYSPERFRWAAALVYSRAFQVPARDEHPAA